MCDFYDAAFVHDLLGAIADYNIAQVHKALEHDIDAVYFGDDWGQQCGLQMGFSYGAHSSFRNCGGCTPRSVRRAGL